MSANVSKPSAAIKRPCHRPWTLRNGNDCHCLLTPTQYVNITHFLLRRVARGIVIEKSDLAVNVQANAGQTVQHKLSPTLFVSTNQIVQLIRVGVQKCCDGRKKHRISSSQTNGFFDRFQSPVCFDELRPTHEGCVLFVLKD